MAKPDKAHLFILLIVLVLLGSGVYIFFQLRTNQISAAIEKNQTLSFLLLVREGEELLFSELVLFHPDTGKSGIIDIPLSLGVIDPRENKMMPIKGLYNGDDETLFLKKVSDLIGFEVEHTLSVGTENLVKFVDLLEGLEFFIANPVEMISDDKMVIIPSGSVVLDGEKAVTYVTYTDPQERQNEEISRKQKFVHSMLRKIGQMSDLFQHREVRKLLHQITDSSLSDRALDSLVAAFGDLDYDQVIYQRVLGNSRLVNEEELLFPYYEGRLIKESLQQTLTALTNREIVNTKELSVSIEILNGTGRSGLAGRTSQIFQSFGYDVVRVGNADHSEYEKTTVTGREGELAAAQQVANVIQCSNVETRKEELPGDELVEPMAASEVVDVTIILGKDFDGRYCKN